MLKKYQLLIDSIITILCIVTVYWININTFMNWDVAWHIEAAKRLLAGGSYLTNLFDTSSPFVFAYFIPLVWLHGVLPIAYPKLMVIYILITSIIPLTLCHLIIDKAYEQNELFIKKLIYYLIVVIMLFVPITNIGHREIVLIYFYFPYFLFIMYTSTYPTTFKLNQPVIYFIVLLAVFGINQNPIYLIIPIFIDLFLFIKNKKLHFYQVFFYISVFLSGLLVLLFYRDYFKEIVPMILCYEGGFNDSILKLLLGKLTFICLLSLFIIFIKSYRLLKETDIAICIIAAVSSLLIYFFELKSWYNHLYPALSFIMVLFTLLITKFYQDYFKNKNRSLRVNLFTASIASGTLIVILIMVASTTKNEWTYFNNPYDQTHQWIKYAKSHFTNKKVLFFVINLGVAYSLPLYGNDKIYIVSPWSNPWIVPYIIRYKGSDGFFCNPTKSITTLHKLATRAITENNPDFIVVEEKSDLPQLQNKRFDYLIFFSQDEKFSKLIKQYSIVDTFDRFIIYKKTKL